MEFQIGGVLLQLLIFDEDGSFFVFFQFAIVEKNIFC